MVFPPSPVEAPWLPAEGSAAEEDDRTGEGEGSRIIYTEHAATPPSNAGGRQEVEEEEGGE